MMPVIYAAVSVFLVASVLSLFGKGGGEFYVPILLTLGLSFQDSASTSLLCLVFSGTAMTMVYHHRMKQVDWHLALVLFLTAGVSAFFGGFFSGGIDAKYLKLIFSAVLIISAAVMYMRSSGIGEKIEEEIESEEMVDRKAWVWHRKTSEGHFDMNLLYVLPPVALVGFLAGMVGISGGGLIVPIIIILGGVPLRTAFSTNSVLVLLTSVMAIFGRGIGYGINLSIALPVASAAFIGALIGSSQSRRIDVKSLGKLFIIVLLLAAIWMLYRAFY